MTLPSTHAREGSTPAAAAAPLRIAVLADDLYPGFGGQARATEGHVGALRARGHAVRVLTGREAEPNEPPEGVEVRRLPAWRPGSAQTHFCLPAPAPVRWLLDGADVLQANTPTPLAMLAARTARRAGMPVTMGVHAQLESTTLHLAGGRRLLGGLLAGWYRHLFDRADLLTAPTAFAARMAAQLSDTPVEVVSNGVVLPTEAVPRAEARRRWAHATGAALQGIALVYVGRLSPEKRPQDLLALLAHLGGDTVLWVAGRGPLEVRMEREARRLGVADRVRFLGFVPEPEKALLLAAADLFLMPSPTELQSIATLEAMAHGCAVAAAGHATSAVPELVREAGAGIVYAPRDPAAGAREVRALLDDPSRLCELQARARRAAAGHAVERSAERLEELYLGLIAAQREASA